MTEQNPTPSRGALRWALILGGLGLALIVASQTASATEYWAVGLPNYSNYDGTIVLTNTDTVAQSATIDTFAGAPVVVPIPALSTATYTMPNPLSTSDETNVGVHRVTTVPEVLPGYYSPINDVYTNDAGRLYEKNELGTEYWVFAYSPGYQGSFLSVIATEPNTQVTVTLTANTLAGGIPAITAPGPYTTTLDAYDVLNLESSGDLQGTHIVASKPVAAFSGGRCVNIGASACDHISEQLQPLTRADRTHVVCASTPARAGNPTVDAMRVMAIGPGATTVTVTPAGSLGPVVTLTGPGDWAEFDINADTVISGDQAVLVGQYYKDSNGQGDPAWVQVSATRTYTAAHAWYSAAPWDHYVLVGAPLGTTTTVDGTPMPGLTAIGATGYGCASMAVPDGTHIAASSQPSVVTDLGVTNYYTSVWFEAPSPALRQEPPTPCAMTGRAYVAHLRLEDVGGTGLVGPTDVWSEDTGDVWTTSSEHHWAGLANTTGPLLVGDAVAGNVDTFAAPECRSESRASALHLEGGPNLPPGIAPFELRVAESWSTSSCKAGSHGGTTIAYLMVGGTVLVDTTGTPTPNTALAVGPVTVVLNEHVAGPGVLEVNAVHLMWPGVFDGKVLSARSDIHDCVPPPPEPDPPCLPVQTDQTLPVAAPVLCADPCDLLEDLAGLRCDVCGLPDGPLQVQSCIDELCDLLDGLLPPEFGIDCTPPPPPQCRINANDPANSVLDCIDQVCDTVLPSTIDCTVGPLPPPPACAIDARDIVNGVRGCLEAWCTWAVQAATGQPVACQIDGIELPCDVGAPAASCVDRVCDQLLSPLGVECQLSGSSGASSSWGLPWGTDALGQALPGRVYSGPTP